MNRYPLWKYLLITLTLLVGAIYAVPNIFGEDPALQISPSRAERIAPEVEDQVRKALDDAGLTFKSIEQVGPRQLLVRLPDLETQTKANEVVDVALSGDHVVALHLAPATPGWLRAISAKPMSLGLDLRGGVHFLMEVDMETVTRQTEERFVGDLRTQLREEKIRYRTIKREEQGGLLLRFRIEAARDQAEGLIDRNIPELEVKAEERGEDFLLRAILTEKFKREFQKDALQQNIATLRNRVNELGVAEPIIQQQGQDRIVVQLPGVQDTARAKDILGATATLEFRMVDTDHDAKLAAEGRAPVGTKLYHERNGSPVLLKKRVLLTGESIVGAASGIDQQSASPAVFITLDGKGASKFSRETSKLIGRPMGVVFMENKTIKERKGDKIVKKKETIEEVINIATIRDQLGKRFQITGLDSTLEARNLALLLRAGALAAPVDIVEERTIGPSLGKENIANGIKSVIIGFVLVLVFMALYYKVFGLVANLALTINLVLVTGLLSMLPTTLTLPGIAGIVLTVGMAVDANVLIFERIREELRNGNTVQASIHAGYERAFSTITDANITTLIAAIVLFGFGTGPIKGFAVTLSLGIICSMFTAIMGTRAVINLIYGNKRVKKLAI